MPTRLRSGLAIAALAATGCGGSSTSGGKAVSPNAPEVNPAGDIPDNQVYVRYAPPGAGYSLKVPEGWSRSAAGGVVTFTDKLNSVSVNDARASAAPSLTHARPRAPKQATGIKAGTVHRNAGTATRITYLVKAAVNPVTGKVGQDAVERYVFFHRGHEVILTLSGPQKADNVDPWRIISNSLAWSR
jgi:hypothetical protein